MLITSEILEPCLSMSNGNVNEVVSDSLKYFTLGSHVCSFTSMITEVQIANKISFAIRITHLTNKLHTP